MIFIINGYMGSGKDTFVSMVTNFFEKKNQWAKISNVSTIDYLKEIFKKEFNWNGEKTDKVRTALAIIHKALNDWNEIPFIRTSETVRQKHLAGEVVFLHCREPENIKKYVEYLKRFNPKTIFINNDNARAATLAKEKSLSMADLQVENYPYDIYIDNNSTFEHLEQQAKNFIIDEIEQF